MKYLEEANLQSKKVNSRLPGDGGGGQLLLNGYKASIWGDEKFWKEQ